MPVNSKGRHINQFGQYVRAGNLEIILTKQLKDIAKEAEVRIRPIIRDVAAKELSSAIYGSYTPATKHGQEIQKYNETHKHQKAAPYHHRGLLASKVYAIIDGDTIKTAIRKEQYKNGASTLKVYDILKYGTPEQPRKISSKTGEVVKGHSSGNDYIPVYVQQKPHNFETVAAKNMQAFIDDFVEKVNSSSWRKSYGIDRYIDKVARKNR